MHRFQCFTSNIATRISAGLVAAALVAACGVASQQTATGGQASPAAAPEAQTQRADVPTAPTGYVLLSDPGVVAPFDYGEAIFGLNIRVAATSHGYYPIGKVEGRGSLCPDGKDWLSISDLKVHTAAEGVTPVAPYLLGCSQKGGFAPATREIVTK